MRNANAANAVAAVAIAFALGACATVPSPDGWSANARESQQDARGAWVNVECVGPADVAQTAWGEMIAVRVDSLFVATPDGLRAFAWADITRGAVVKYNPDLSAAVGASLLGTFATLSNGFFLVFTAPIWILTGVSTTHSLARDAMIKLPPTEEDAANMAMYARFPQGLPDGADRSILTLPMSTQNPERPAASYPARVPRSPNRYTADTSSYEYASRRKVGGGVTAQAGLHTAGGTMWSLGVCPRVFKSLFVTGSFGRTHSDHPTMDHVGAGVRLGRQYFVGARYIHSWYEDHDGDGWGLCVGALSGPRSGFSAGVTFGFDWLNLDEATVYYDQVRNFGWLALTLQFSPSALHEPKP